MTESEQRTNGREMFSKVYGGVVNLPPVEGNKFLETMLDHLFGKIWTKSSLSVRDRRLMIMGILVAQCQADIFGIQIESALDRGELSPEQVEDVMVFLAHYAGYPRASSVLSTVMPIVQKYRNKK